MIITPAARAKIDLARLAGMTPLARLTWFVKRAWTIAEPTGALVWDWHLDEICAHMIAWHEGRCPDNLLLINIAPGMSKSMICSILFPAWVWTENPKARFLCVSYEGQLARDDFATRWHAVITSPWYCERWGDLMHGSGAVQSKEKGSLYVNVKGGRRYSRGMGEAITGTHADYIILDDPLKAGDAGSNDDGKTKRSERIAKERLSTTLSNRTTGAHSRFMCVMQRLGQGDPSGWFIERGATHLVLPHILRDPSKRSRTPFGGDRRTRAGECLAPKRYADGLKYWKRKERDFYQTGGESAVEAQLYQNPTPPGGNIFKHEGLRNRFRAADHRTSTGRIGHITIVSVDAAFTGSADPVAIEVWGYEAGHFYCWYSEVERMTFTQMCDRVRIVRDTFQPHTVLVELAANGAALIDTLEREALVMITRVEGVVAAKSKSARAKAASLYVNPPMSRTHYLEGAEWLDRKINNMATFPSPEDHDVDATSQALTWLAENFGHATHWAEALDATAAATRKEAQETALDRTLEGYGAARPAGVRNDGRPARSIYEMLSNPDT